jgi:hypothetical protein
MNCRLPERVRPAATRHPEHILRQQRHGVERAHLAGERRGLEHLQHVLVVVAAGPVRRQRHGDAAAAHLRHARHARRQIHVGDRAVHDHAAVLLQQVQLVVVEPDAVDELHVGAERTQRASHSTWRSPRNSRFISTSLRVSAMWIMLPTPHALPCA